MGVADIINASGTTHSSHEIVKACIRRDGHRHLRQPARLVWGINNRGGQYHFHHTSASFSRFATEGFRYMLANIEHLVLMISHPSTGFISCHISNKSGNEIHWVWRVNQKTHKDFMRSGQSTRSFLFQIGWHSGSNRNCRYQSSAIKRTAVWSGCFRLYLKALSSDRIDVNYERQLLHSHISSKRDPICVYS